MTKLHHTVLKQADEQQYGKRGNSLDNSARKPDHIQWVDISKNAVGKSYCNPVNLRKLPDLTYAPQKNVRYYVSIETIARDFEESDLASLLRAHTWGAPLIVSFVLPRMRSVKGFYADVRGLFHCSRCLTYWKEFGRVPKVCYQEAYYIQRPTFPLSISDAITLIDILFWSKKFISIQLENHLGLLRKAGTKEDQNLMLHNVLRPNQPDKVPQKEEYLFVYVGGQVGPNGHMYPYGKFLKDGSFEENGPPVKTRIKMKEMICGKSTQRKDEAEFFQAFGLADFNSTTLKELYFSDAGKRRNLSDAYPKLSVPTKPPSSGDSAETTPIANRDILAQTQPPELREPTLGESVHGYLKSISDIERKRSLSLKISVINERCRRHSLKDDKLTKQLHRIYNTKTLKRSRSPSIATVQDQSSEKIDRRSSTAFRTFSFRSISATPRSLDERTSSPSQHSHSTKLLSRPKSTSTVTVKQLNTVDSKRRCTSAFRRINYSSSSAIEMPRYVGERPLSPYQQMPPIEGIARPNSPNFEEEEEENSLSMPDDLNLDSVGSLNLADEATLPLLNFTEDLARNKTSVSVTDQNDHVSLGRGSSTVGSSAAQPAKVLNPNVKNRTGKPTTKPGTWYRSSTMEKVPNFPQEFHKIDAPNSFQRRASLDGVFRTSPDFSSKARYDDIISRRPTSARLQNKCDPEYKQKIKGEPPEDETHTVAIKTTSETATKTKVARQAPITITKPREKPTQTRPKSVPFMKQTTMLSQFTADVYDEHVSAKKPETLTAEQPEDDLGLVIDEKSEETLHVVSSESEAEIDTSEESEAEVEAEAEVAEKVSTFDENVDVGMTEPQEFLSRYKGISILNFTENFRFSYFNIPGHVVEHNKKLREGTIDTHFKEYRKRFGKSDSRTLARAISEMPYELTDRSLDPKTRSLVKAFSRRASQVT